MRLECVVRLTRGILASPGLAAVSLSVRVRSSDPLHVAQDHASNYFNCRCSSFYGEKGIRLTQTLVRSQTQRIIEEE